MKARSVFVYTMLIFFFFVLKTESKDYKLYYLGGQSNMDGYGLVKELPPELNTVLKGVMIFHGSKRKDDEPAEGKGIWTELRPGHGGDFKSDGITNTYSEEFGPELTFASTLQQLDTNSNIAIIKYSKGGTSIGLTAGGRYGTWDPDYNLSNGINQYDHFLATLRNALAVKDIDGDGEEDTLIPTGIVWMQGESDGASGFEVAKVYEENLKRLMDLIRAALHSDDLPVVIGRISESGQDEKNGKVWNYGETIRASQREFVKKDANAALVTATDNYGYSDKYHYDSAGFIELGKEFAKAMYNLQSKISLSKERK